MIGTGVGIGCEISFWTGSTGGCCCGLGLLSLPVTLKFSISSSSSIVGKYCWNSDTLVELNGDTGAILGESDVEDTGDGGPKLEAGMSVCGVCTTGVDTDCV